MKYQPPTKSKRLKGVCVQTQEILLSDRWNFPVVYGQVKFHALYLPQKSCEKGLHVKEGNAKLTVFPSLQNWIKGSCE